jgi:hypothetical protein
MTDRDMAEEVREAAYERYVREARELMRRGDELRAGGARGHDTPVMLDPRRFLEVIESAKAAGVREGIRQAREAIETARPTTFNLNWGWRAVSELERGEDQPN